jgi:hypothetical protein
MPGAPRTYEPTQYPIPGQDGPGGFKHRLAQYIKDLPDHLEIEYVRQWLPGEERFTVDWREQARRIREGAPYELTITIRDRRR